VVDETVDLISPAVQKGPVGEAGDDVFPSPHALLMPATSTTAQSRAPVRLGTLTSRTTSRAFVHSHSRFRSDGCQPADGPRPTGTERRRGPGRTAYRTAGLATIWRSSSVASGAASSAPSAPARRGHPAFRGASQHAAPASAGAWHVLLLPGLLLLLQLLDELLRVVVSGIEFNGLPVVEDRFVNPARAHERFAQAVVRIG
jgi:hypothetical protein